MELEFLRLEFYRSILRTKMKMKKKNREHDLENVDLKKKNRDLENANPKKQKRKMKNKGRICRSK